MAETTFIDQMAKVSVVEAVELIKSLDSSIPVMLHGEPGVGKTKTIQQVFEKLGYEVNPVLAGQSEPTDIQGIPFPVEEGYTSFSLMWWAWRASDHPEVPEEHRGKMVLFFDDLPTAPEQTQAALFKFIDEGYAGEYKIRDNVRMIAAGNRIEDMSAVTEMPFALRNRFLHLYVKPDHSAWQDWAIKNAIHPNVTFYLQKNPIRLTTFDDAKDSGAHAWATPRTWEMLSKILFSLEKSELRGEQEEATEGFSETDIDKNEAEFVAIQGCIGALATDFVTTIKSEYSVVPIQEILEDPENAEVPTVKEIDRLWGTVYNLNYFANDPENISDYWQEFLIYAQRLPKEFSFLLGNAFINMVLPADKGISDEVREEIFGSEAYTELFQYLKSSHKLNL